jgi:predicted DNA-binding transcriptional regulator YafY
MPWKECSVAELCREFGISRKTGYKIFDRYQECGVQGLTDRSRRPYRYCQVPRRQFRAFSCGPPNLADLVAQSQVLELEGGTRTEDRGQSARSVAREMRIRGE